MAEASIIIPPPPEASYITHHELDQSYIDWGIQNGSDWVKDSLKRQKTRTKRILRCGNSNTYRDKIPEDERQRRFTTRKKECPAMIWAIYHNDGSAEIKHATGMKSFMHNHEASPSGSLTANQRRSKRNKELKALVLRHNQLGIKPEVSLELINDAFPGSGQTRQDIYNIIKAAERARDVSTQPTPVLENDLLVTCPTCGQHLAGASQYRVASRLRVDLHPNNTVLSQSTAQSFLESH